MHNDSIRLDYSPLSFLGKTHGTLLFLGGLFLIYSFVGEVQHRLANLGQTDPFFVGVFDYFLWFGFLLVSLGVTFVGCALFFAKRTTYFEKDGTMIVHDFSGFLRRRYSGKEVRGLYLVERPIFVLFGVGLGGGVKASTVGTRFVLELALKDSKVVKILSLFKTQREGEDVLHDILQVFKPKAQVYSKVFVDVVKGREAKLHGEEAELYKELHREWESNPDSMDLKVDLLELCERLDWSQKRLVSVLESLEEQGVAKLG